MLRELFTVATLGLPYLGLCPARALVSAASLVSANPTRRRAVASVLAAVLIRRPRRDAS